MSGYYGYSMSNNAMDAYDEGKMPISKWTKKAILAAAESYFVNEAHDEQAEQKMTLLRKMKVETLKKHLLACTEWHHSSKFYNRTDFYALCDLAEISLEDMDSWLSAAPSATTEKPVAETPLRKKGKIFYIVWGGTRNHPRATEKMLENVYIEERGCFYEIYDAGGKLILKKKIGSNGTHVLYTK